MYPGSEYDTVKNVKGNMNIKNENAICIYLKYKKIKK